jgi:hypothetical protein
MVFWGVLQCVLKTDYSEGLQVVDALRLVEAQQAWTRCSAWTHSSFWTHSSASLRQTFKTKLLLD